MQTLALYLKTELFGRAQELHLIGSLDQDVAWLITVSALILQCGLESL